MPVGLSGVENYEGSEFGDEDSSKTQELDDEFMLLTCPHFVADCSSRIKSLSTIDHSHFSNSESERRRSVSVCVTYLSEIGSRQGKHVHATFVNRVYEKASISECRCTIVSSPNPFRLKLSSAQRTRPNLNKH